MAFLQLSSIRNHVNLRLALTPKLGFFVPIIEVWPPFKMPKARVRLTMAFFERAGQLSPDWSQLLSDHMENDARTFWDKSPIFALPDLYGCIQLAEYSRN